MIGCNGCRRGSTSTSWRSTRTKVGSDTQILIERAGRHGRQMIGKSPWLQSVHVETERRPGDIIDVAVVAAGQNSLTGAELQRAAA